VWICIVSFCLLLCSGRGAEYCGESVCLSVALCLSVPVFQKLRVQTSLVFLCVLPASAARSSSGGVVIRSVHDVTFARDAWRKGHILKVTQQRAAVI